MALLDFDKKEALEAYQLIADAYVYPLPGSILALCKADDRGGRCGALLEKGTLYTTIEYYHCLLRESKLDRAIEVCVAEPALHSLDLMEPLLILLTRKKTACVQDVQKSAHYVALMELVAKVISAPSAVARGRI